MDISYTALKLNNILNVNLVDEDTSKYYNVMLILALIQPFDFIDIIVIIYRFV